VEDGFDLFVSILATWRLCHLVASEDGPFDMIVRVRQMAGDGMWGRLMDCPYCLSLWFAIPFAVVMADGWIEGSTLWLAISGGACLIEMAAALMRARAEPPVIDLPKPD
jgi:hypothetical protein